MSYFGLSTLGKVPAGSLQFLCNKKVKTVILRTWLLKPDGFFPRTLGRSRSSALSLYCQVVLWHKNLEESRWYFLYNLWFCLKSVTLPEWGSFPGVVFRTPPSGWWLGTLRINVFQRRRSIWRRIYGSRVLEVRIKVRPSEILAYNWLAFVAHDRIWPVMCISNLRNRHQNM